MKEKKFLNSSLARYRRQACGMQGIANQEEKRAGAVITVFFALSGLLILALTGSMLYAALYAGAKAVGERALHISAKSVLAGYFLPLYEDYHIFSRTAGGSGLSSEADLSEELAEWLSCNLETGADKAGNGFLQAQEIIGCGVSGVEYMLSGDGSRFLEQALAYQKYRSVSDAILGIAGLKKEMEGLPAASVVLKHKEQAEQKYAEAMLGTADLMRLIDGVKFEQSFFIIKRKGIYAVDKFVKKMWSGEINASKAGINHPDVFDTMKDHYVRFDVLIQEGLDEIAEAEGQEGAIAALEAEISELESEITALTGIKSGEEEVNKLLERKKELCLLLAKAQDKREEGWNNWSIRLEKMLTVSRESSNAMKEAVELTDEIKKKLEEAEKELNVYETILEAGRNQLSPELYKQLRTELVQLKDRSAMNYDLDACQESLFNWWETVLEIRMKLLQLRNRELPSEERQVIFDKLLFACGQLPFEGPSFDYGGLQTGKTGESIPELFEKLISSGIAALVLPEDAESSCKKLPDTPLPSDWRGLTPEEEVKAGLSDLFGQPLYGIVHCTTDKILYLQYASDHFSCYTKECEKSTALAYELEYLLCGKKEDKANLNGSISRIVLVRTLIHFISLMTDSAARGEVRRFAETAAFFSGIPALQLVLMTALLFVWAAGLALIEVCAMLNGKKPEVLPDRNRRAVQFSELLQLSPAFIRARGEAFEETGAVRAGYEEYLQLLCFAVSQEKLNYRSMDLIEANMRERFDPDFRMLKCICGYSAWGEFTLPVRFPVFPFIRDELTQNKMTYRLEVHTEY